MKLKKYYKQYKSDIEAVAKFYNVDISELIPPGEAGGYAVWNLFYEARSNRAYDDSHPRWRMKKRILPYDGSNYHEFYHAGADASHLKTLMKRIYKDIVKERKQQ